MSLDGRVKDALERFSQMVAPDVRRDLVTVRRKARRAVVVKRVGGALLAAALVIAAVSLGPRILEASRSQRPARPGGSAASLGPVATYPLVGTWTQEQSCEDFVRALTRYGLPRHAPGFLLWNGYREGPRSAIAADPHPCRGASRAVRRTWVFDGNKLRGFIGSQRHQVDFAFTAFPDDHTMRISHINLGFRVGGDTLRFIVPPIPRTCTGPDCLSQHAWAVAAFGLGPWTRTRDR
jgi:hypothetical protein